MAGLFGAPLVASNLGMDPRALMAGNSAAAAMRDGMQAQPPQHPLTQQMPDMAPPQTQTPQQYLRPKRTLSENLGLLADAFSGSDRNTQMLLAREGQHRAEWQAQQNALLKRAQDFADWQTKFDYEQKNRVPTPYRWESNDGSLMELGADGQPRVAYKDPTPKTEWIRTTDPTTGEIIMTPMTMGGGAAPRRTAPQGVTFTPLPDSRGPASAPGGFRR